jgi:hypothetical protein
MTVYQEISSLLTFGILTRDKGESESRKQSKVWGKKKKRKLKTIFLLVKIRSFNNKAVERRIVSIHHYFFFLAKLSTFYDGGIDEAIDIVYKRNKTSHHFILPESHRSKVNCDWLT